MSWFKKKPAPAPAQVAVVTAPPTLNPTEMEERAFAEWRVAHIDRWLVRNEATAPTAKVENLKAERDMYAAKLRIKP